jgi:hypothetical protein
MLVCFALVSEPVLGDTPSESERVRLDSHAAYAAWRLFVPTGESFTAQSTLQGNETTVMSAAAWLLTRDLSLMGWWSATAWGQTTPSFHAQAFETSLSISTPVMGVVGGNVTAGVLAVAGEPIELIAVVLGSFEGDAQQSVRLSTSPGVIILGESAGPSWDRERPDFHGTLNMGADGGVLKTAVSQDAASSVHAENTLFAVFEGLSGSGLSIWRMRTHKDTILSPARRGETDASLRMQFQGDRPEPMSFAWSETSRLKAAPAALSATQISWSMSSVRTLRFLEGAQSRQPFRHGGLVSHGS